MVDYAEDDQYICPECGNTVTYWNPDRRMPRTLKCGSCDCRFDWRTGEIIHDHNDVW